MYFDDLEVGQVLTGRKRVVTGTDIDIFAALTGAVNPLFLSRSFASSLQLRDRVAPGALTLALMIGGLYQIGLFDDIIALAEIDRLQFLHPTYPDDILESQATVKTKKQTSKPDRGVAIFDALCKNQDGKEVLKAELTFLMKCR